MLKRSSEPSVASIDISSFIKQVLHNWELACLSGIGQCPTRPRIWINESTERDQLLTGIQVVVLDCSEKWCLTTIANGVKISSITNQLPYHLAYIWAINLVFYPLAHDVNDF